MYSDDDIDEAVAAGVMPAATAAAFRDHVATRRIAPIADEEQFRLLTGFNDIFVAIAITLLLVALSQIGGWLHPIVSGLLVTGASWGLALFFTARRRMALPSILLLLTFVGGVAATAAMTVGMAVAASSSPRAAAVVGTTAAAAAAAAAWIHWRRFMVPITVAAGAAALVALAAALVLVVWPNGANLFALILVGGLATFAWAMKWDLSDPERRTRRSDVAFWLHLLAAPMLAHSAFKLLGVYDGDIGLAKALLVLLLYIAFALVALAIDRRALLVSSLGYVLYALSTLIRSAGTVELSWAFTALLIGSALLMLSAFWQPFRRQVVSRLGPWRHRLPPVAALRETP
jgi:MFS family permease